MKTRFLINNHYRQAFDKKIKSKLNEKDQNVKSRKSCSTDVGKPFTNDLFQHHIIFSAQNPQKSWSEDYPK